MKGKAERKVLWIGISFLFFVLALEGLFLWVISPRLQIRTVHLDSDLHLDDEWIYEITGLNEDSRYLALQEDRLEERLLSVPQIGEAEVHKRFPSGLDILIRKRVAVALVWKEDLQSQSLLAVDRQGILFPNDQGLSLWDLPVISGLDPVLLEEAAPLGSQLQLLLQDLEALKVINPAYYGILSEIRVIPQEGEGFSLEMYLTTHHIAAQCDLPLDREKMEKIILVLDVLEEQGKSGEIGEVDIRMGSIRYRRREV